MAAVASLLPGISMHHKSPCQDLKNFVDQLFMVRTGVKVLRGLSKSETFVVIALPFTAPSGVAFVGDR